jgi:hypothetical protein
MTDLSTLTNDNREAVARFIADARRVSGSAWLMPPGPGKWSPAQVVEHVCLAYELSQRAIHGTFPGPSAPRFLRPVIRKFFLDPVLRNGRFGKGGKAPAVFQPTGSPGTAASLLSRLEAASDGLSRALEAEARNGRPFITHPFFGRIPATDFMRLQQLHTEHHRVQLPGNQPG